jgi:hypothetical protein
MITLPVLPRFVQLVFVLIPALSITLLISTYIFTSLRYKLTRYSARSSPGSNQGQPLGPAKIPYTIPFLGSAISFLLSRHGDFWRGLLRAHPRDSGACTILLGGLSTHILFSPHAISEFFKARDTTRQSFNNQVVQNALGLTHDECVAFYGLKQSLDEKENSKNLHPLKQQEKINQETLLKTESVNELTSEFSKLYAQQLSEDDGFQETAFYEWLRPRMFKASTIAFMGQRVIEIYPELEPDFFIFDKHMLSLFFGLPKFFISEAHKVRNRMLDRLELFNKTADEESKGTPVNAQGDVKWEPIYGSRANRARQGFYRDVGLSMRARAGMDLGFLFGLSSNAIPATGYVYARLHEDPKALGLTFSQVGCSCMF